MHKPRYFLLLAIGVLALGCYLVVGGQSINRDDWPTYMGATCLILSLCVAALIEAIQAQGKRIALLEQKLATRPGSDAPGG